MAKSSGPIRVLIADDHPIMCAGIRATLEKAPDIQVVGQVTSSAEVQPLTADLCPDILLLDLVMPGLRASEIEKWVCAHCPETTTLVLTAHDRECYLAEMVEAGVAGYLTKDQAPDRLIEAIRRAARGEYLITGEQLARAHHWRKEAGECWECLTRREREVLQLLAQGSDNTAIAKALNVTEKTAAYHVANVLRKLGAASRQEAIVWVHTHLPEDLVKIPG